MASLIVDIADAVAAALNAEPGLGVQAVRYYRPEFDVAELKEVRVSVVPRGIVQESVSRSALQTDVAVDVAVQKKVDAGKPEQLDELMALVEQVAGLLKHKRFDVTGGSAAWVKTENQPIYSPEHLQQKQVFTSVLTVTFRVIR